MSNRQYTDEFKAEAIKQVIERGCNDPVKTCSGVT